MRLERAAAAASVVGGLLASACCIGPVVFALLGVAGAGLAHGMEPLRPFLLALTYSTLAGAFYFNYRRAAASCGPGNLCERSRTDRTGRVLLWTATAAVILATAFPWYAESLVADAPDVVTRTTITIEGMTCGGCGAAVKIQLKRTEGVTAYEVSWEKGEAVVSYDPARTDPTRIVDSISRTGFKAAVKSDKAAAPLGRSAPRREPAGSFPRG